MLRYAGKIVQDLRSASLETSRVPIFSHEFWRIGVGISACMNLLPPVLERFKLHPKIEFEIITGMLKKKHTSLSQEEIDHYC